MSKDAVPLPADFDPSSMSTAWTVTFGDADALELETELRLECPEGHTLHGVRAVSVAVRQHRKEAIFWLPDRSAWAVVHLTWNRETDPLWPSTELCPTWAEVIAELEERGRP